MNTPTASSAFSRTLGIILNMDADHLDFFKDIDDIRHSFRKFAELLPADGALIINADTPKYEMVAENLPCKVITYGLEHDAEYTASDITYDEFGHPTFHVLHNGEDIGTCSLKVPGIHNVSNALASIAAGRLLGLDNEVIFAGAKDFGGADRRFQYKGEVDGVTIIDDYAHHPTEIAATLNSSRQNYPHRKMLVCLPAAHLYQNQSIAYGDLRRRLSMADHVVLADIYAARETDNSAASALGDLLAKIEGNLEHHAIISRLSMRSRNFYLKNCIQRRPVDNYGGRRRRKHGRTSSWSDKLSTLSTCLSHIKIPLHEHVDFFVP